MAQSLRAMFSHGPTVVELKRGNNACRIELPRKVKARDLPALMVAAVAGVEAAPRVAEWR